MQIKAIKTRIFEENEDLIEFIIKYIPKLKENSILVVTSKIVALSEGRTKLVKSKKEKEELIKSESEWVMQTKYVWATLKNGMLAANAGVDSSNARGKLIMLPKDCMTTAQELLKKLKKKYRVRRLGILITDSRVMPLRAGVIGAALGYAGFAGIRDYRGTKDIFGKKLKFTRTNVADSLATACTVVMGEGKEQTPLGIVTEAPVKFMSITPKNELKIDVRDDMFGPLFKSFPTRAKI